MQRFFMRKLTVVFEKQDINCQSCLDKLRQLVFLSLLHALSFLAVLNPYFFDCSSSIDQQFNSTRILLHIAYLSDS